MNLAEIKAAFQGLIRIPSTTQGGHEEDACAYLEKILDEYGISHERICRVPDRPNLLAKIPAVHPRENALVLISHIDVVPGVQEKWTCPIFCGDEFDGRIWGRGTLDTKQLTMMELYGFLGLKGREEELDRDVYFLAAIDEEMGSSYGMGYVKQARPDFFENKIVINEGGGFPLHINGKDYMMLTVGEKAVCKVRVWAEGKGGHASAPSDDQAMLKLAEGLRRIFADEKSLNCGSHRTYESMRRIVGSDDWDNAVGADIFGYASQNSIGMRKYQIGERTNVIPGLAEATLEFKVLPYTAQEEITAYLDKNLEGLPVHYEVLSYENGFESHLENSHLKELAEDLQTACNRNGFEGRVVPMLALGRTDGRFFGASGSMVYGCSPLLMGDSFDVILPKVHGNDESILVDSFNFGCKVLKEIIEKICLTGGKQ